MYDLHCGADTLHGWAMCVRYAVGVVAAWMVHGGAVYEVGGAALLRSPATLPLPLAALLAHWRPVHSVALLQRNTVLR